MTKVVNLTPHEINIVGEQNRNILPSGQVARVTEEIKRVGTVDGIPIIHKTFGEVEGLPEPQSDTVFIVSLLVAQAAKRIDVLAIGETVRNEKGQVIGAKSLAMV
jgi:hypothetical protein